MDPEAAQGTDQESAAERREAFRKAGEEYFEQLLLDAATKGDAASPGVPLPVSTSASTGVSAPSAQSGTPLTAARTPGKRRRRGDVENADVAAMGALIERSKNVFLMAVLTATRAAWTVLLKGSYVVGIATPGLLCFFHKLAVVAVIYGLSMWKVLEVGPISRSMVQNSVVHVTIHACKQLALFGMLLHGSVYGMLAWTTALPELVGAGVAMRVHGTGPRPEDRSIMAMVVAGLVLELAYDQHQGGLTWAMFIIWTGLLTLEVLWEVFHRHPTSFAAVLGEEVLSQLTAVCEREKQIPEPDMVLLRHSVPAVPILLLGLLLQEGEELLEHDLTVPSATMMLLSCAAFASAEAALMLMPHSPSEHSQALLAAATQGLIILLDFFERAHSNSVFALIGVVTTCAAVAALKLRGGNG